ncbi:PX domain-containing protein kinase-like protein [Chionoecetes opilio]|uniref:PX domain-containing protein kinase-like protein n=1 Tax=Chionoecetes opilio TaxID=41210 RepID=A0A8J5CEV0_CHIOP|nr:PX domain-containing protein kinase-like protein [Chionoecetes opilio]
MAVFERKKEDRLGTDDTKPLVCRITDTQNTEGHVEYLLEVWRIPDVETKWNVSHRYSDFAQLHAALRVGTVALPTLPPKKVFGNTDRDFINERRLALQVEEGRQNVHLVLRSGGSHEVTEAIPQCGTRVTKVFFLAHPLADPKTQHVLWWSPFGPDRAMNLRDTHATLTALVHCQHPYIVASVSSVATEAGVCVVRPWIPQGSLRDMIHQTRPKASALVKYSGDKLVAVAEKKCAVYGRQVLEALLFLHEKGLGHGHIHTGNMVIENNVCRLLDLENQVVGLPNQLRAQVVLHRRINSIEAIDVYGFGHALYEMLFQRRLEADTCEDFPPECSPMPRSVLESILSVEACKNGLPTVAGLLTHPFFNEVPLHSYEKPILKLPSSVKQAVAASHQGLLTRLAADQKKVRQQRKVSKAELFVSQRSIKVRPKKHLHLETNGLASGGDTLSNPADQQETR